MIIGSKLHINWFLENEMVFVAWNMITNCYGYDVREINIRRWSRKRMINGASGSRVWCGFLMWIFHRVVSMPSNHLALGRTTGSFENSDCRWIVEGHFGIGSVKIVHETYLSPKRTDRRTPKEAQCKKLFKTVQAAIPILTQPFYFLPYSLHRHCLLVTLQTLPYVFSMFLLDPSLYLLKCKKIVCTRKYKFFFSFS